MTDTWLYTSSEKLRSDPPSLTAWYQASEISYRGDFQAFSLSASAVQGEQLYDPYGSHRYAEGTLGTDKGYTGQFIDAATGLAYDHARYYLRHIGVFLSPDDVQGNAQGMDPYSYVNGNPETKTDPTGHRIVDPGPGGGGGCPSGEEPVSGGCAPDPGSGGGNNGGGNNGGPCEWSGGNPQYCPSPTPPPTGGGGCGSGHTGACVVELYGCNAKCRAEAKPVAQGAAQNLRGLASQVQKIIDAFNNCSDLDFNCVIHELFSDLEGGGIIGALVGAIIGCVMTIEAGCIGGGATGAGFGGGIGALVGLGYFVYYEIVKHSTISMLQSLQELLNSGASSLEQQQLDDPSAFDHLNNDYGSYNFAVENFIANDTGQLSDKANAIANQAWQIYSQAINTEEGYFCVCQP